MDYAAFIDVWHCITFGFGRGELLEEAPILAIRSVCWVEQFGKSDPENSWS
jgi:hypothetical protein